MKKRILAAVLAMLLVFGFTTVSAWAAAAPVTDEAGLTAALANGGEIILDSGTSMIKVTTDLTITKDTTIDLNGKTIYFSYVGADHQLLIDSGAKLTITDSSAAKEGGINGDSDNINGRVINNGTLILNAGAIACGLTNNGTFDMNGGSVCNVGSSTYEVIVNNGTMYADGGKAPSYYGEDSDNYGTITVSTGCTAPTEFGCDVNNLTDGIISGGIYNKQVKQTGANTVISGGTFNGTVTGEAGTISGGTFKGHVQTNYTSGAVVSGGIFYGTYNFNTSNVENSAYVSVAYGSNGGTVVYPEVIIRGQKATEPTAPKKVGFIFKGWYKDADLTEEYDFDSAVISDITLYAGWEKCDHSDSTNKATCTSGATCSVCGGNIEKLGHWFKKDENSWKCTREDCSCEVAITAADAPTIEIKGADKVCKTQDYTFSFDVPENCEFAGIGYDFASSDDGLIPKQDGNTYTATLEKEIYRTDETSFDVFATVKDGEGDYFQEYKTVQLLAEHEGGVASCTKAPVCTVCGATYGEADPDNHVNLKHFPAKAATTAETGNKEYWYCDVCEKYFSDADAANVIPDGKDGVVIPKLPVIIKGDEQKITVGEKKALEFTSDAAYDELRHVLIDGKELDAKNYTAAAAADGSTVVTLKADYVSTLSAGKHTLGIVSENGTATATFTVNKKAAETTTTTDKPTTNDDTKSPQTGDNSNMFLWLALILVSSGAVTATTIAGRKRKYNR